MYSYAITDPAINPLRHLRLWKSLLCPLGTLWLQLEHTQHAQHSIITETPLSEILL